MSPPATTAEIAPTHASTTATAVEPTRALMRDLLVLALPVLAEQFLHILVGVNDTYLANHLPNHAADAGAAVGTITYFLWFFGVLVSSVGTGSTAIIARAKGSRHRSLANSVCGQSVSAAVIMGIVVGVGLYVFAEPIIVLTRLQGPARPLALSYLRMLSVTLPFTNLMFIAGSCQRGYGDTITPAIVMVIVDIINMLFSFALTRGWWGLPVMGYDGIAQGTIIAYVAGGVMQFVVLVRGISGVRLHLHRLRPHWTTIKRLFRIGLPAGAADILGWMANLGVIGVINQIDPTNASAAAHMSAIRVESFSFLPGMAFAIAAATLVGQSLGMKRPDRARRCAYLAYAVGGGIMTLCGIAMITLGRYPARWLAPPDPHIIDLTTRCLFITGFIQSGFAANIIFGGALRGAGDTLAVMALNLTTVIGIRFVGVIVVGLHFQAALPVIWVVLASELFMRGTLVYFRFVHGGWRKVAV
jgi:putative MATE family efflux protein